MTSSKRLKKTTQADEVPKRRRHSVPPSTPKLESGGKSVRRASLSTPKAPTRKRASARSPDWLRIIMTTTGPSTRRTRSDDKTQDAGLDELVFVEWPQWNTTTWELLYSECSWMHLFLIAARYGSIAVVEEIIDRLPSTQINQLVNEYQQNALVALCSQPPAEILVFEQQQYRPACLRNVGHNSASQVELGGAKSTMILDSFTQAAECRQEELGLIAALLLRAKVDPSRPDQHGHSALDYARKFTHHSILNEFDRKISSSILTNRINLSEQLIEDAPPGTPTAADEEFGTPTVILEHYGDVTYCHTPIATPVGDEEDYATELIYSRAPVMVQKKNLTFSPTSGQPRLYPCSELLCRASTTIDTEYPADVETPRGMSPAQEPEEDLVIQSCASSLPTACEITSQKRRGKRLHHATNKNLYAGLNDLHELIAIDAEKRAALRD